MSWKQMTKAVLVPLIEELHHVGEDGRVLSARRTQSHNVPTIEQLVSRNGIVHLILQSVKEAVLANLNNEPTT
jgi:hypothetical protein